MIWMFLRSLFRPNIRRNILTLNAAVSGVDMLLYMRNVIQKLVVTGSTGTYTLTFDGQTTNTIGYDAFPSSIQTALEGLSNIDVGDVEVIGVGPGPGTVYIEFKVQYAAQDVILIVATISEDIVITITKIHNDIQKLTLADGDGSESYKLTYRGQTTATILWDATPAQVETALELLSTITSVAVSGTTGTEYFVEFDGAQTSNMDNPALVVTETGGNLAVTVTSPMPDTNLLGGQRSTVLSRTIDKADATNKDSLNWEESVPIIRHWSISCSGFVIVDEADAALEALKQIYINGLDLDVLLKMPSGNQYEGIGHLDSFDKEGPFDGIFTASLEVSGNGVLTKRT